MQGFSSGDCNIKEKMINAEFSSESHTEIYSHTAVFFPKKLCFHKETYARTIK